MTDSDTNQSNAVVLKRDGHGRVRTTAAQRAGLLAEYERSGLSGPAFCRVAGINYQTFVCWRQDQRAAATAQAPALPPLASTPSIRLVEAALSAAMPAAAASAGMEVVLPGGARLLVADAAQAVLAAQLIKALS